MIVYFLLSIINSMAQSNLKHRYHQELELRTKQKSVATTNGGLKNAPTSTITTADSKDDKKD